MRFLPCSRARASDDDETMISTHGRRSALTTALAREGTDFERDEYDDFSRLADDETQIGALDPNRPDPEEFFDFDSGVEPEYAPVSALGAQYARDLE